MSNQQKNPIHFKHVYDENDVMYHYAYIMLCDIFPNMMPYWVFKNYTLTIAQNQTTNELVGFMLLESNYINNKSNNFSESTESTYQSDLTSSTELVDLSDSICSSGSTDSIESIGSTESTESISDGDKIITIASFGICDKYRNKGIGDMYIKWLKMYYPNCPIDLHVSIKNINAIKLYEKHNFIINKTVKKYYTDMSYEPYTAEGVDAYYMVATCSIDEFRNLI